MDACEHDWHEYRAEIYPTPATHLWAAHTYMIRTQRCSKCGELRTEETTMPAPWTEEAQRRQASQHEEAR